MTTELRYRRIREVNPYLYADITLLFENMAINISGREFKLLIMSSLKILHGDLGAAIQVDVLKFDEKLKRAYLRFETKYYTKLRSALTLMFTWNGTNCAFRIHKVCHNLSSLSLDSDNQIHKVVIKT